MDNLKLLLSIFFTAAIMFIIVYVGLTTYSSNAALDHQSEDVFASPDNRGEISELKQSIQKTKNFQSNDLNPAIATKVIVKKEPEETFAAVQQDHPDTFYDAGPSANSQIEMGEPIWPVTQKDIAAVNQRFERNKREIERLRTKDSGR